MTGRPTSRSGWSGAVKGAPALRRSVGGDALDPQAQAFLHDHQFDGTPVLPGVMGTEAFAEVAGLVGPTGSVAGIEHVEFLLPFKFFRMQPATLHCSRLGPPARWATVVGGVAALLVQPKPELPVQERVHFRGRVA